MPNPPTPDPKHSTPPAPKRQEPPNTPKKPDIEEPPPEHEGAVEAETGDRTGPGAGYDNEPKKVNDKGGVAPS